MNKDVKQEADASGGASQPKPLVHYMELLACELGKSAHLVPADHPSKLVSNTQMVLTSVVVVGPDALGSFETMNTRYVRAPSMKR